MTWQPWREAMTEALYGPDGFYRRPAGPAAHFRTSVHVSPLFAEALLRLAEIVWRRVDEFPDFVVVDVGAGRGELLRQLAPLAPPRWRLVGVDVLDRPGDLPDRVEWRRGLDQLEQVRYGLLVANEWLDNIPVDVVHGDRLVEVDSSGRERQGAATTQREQAWHDAWAYDLSDRMEIGWPRDQAWADAVSRIDAGLALAVDYRLDPAVHRSGTLTGYRDGRQVPPVPDGSCDLTAHVLLESCAQAAGGDHVLLDQRTALRRLGVPVTRPPREQASSDPSGYLRALAATSHATELTAKDGLGRFGWLVQPRALEAPPILGLRPGR